ncbi:TetR/AcrR family transcriptional regulator [Nocardia flavorosea]|uniref:TetR/AcrR family transcriptional regulator n=1 Tax=Nocardia flavorosea TaxID=53429 RepID=A0A846YH37_9NOCA|nr:TetR/AcrR family transcriptional regulator [Nocardia flavorosea]NKY56169.1 TetR/AcrR family transcriptional regulator [Nocardia flavorosea]
MTVPAGGRKARLRAATLHEIHQTARDLLVEQGSGAVTINGVARRMGMSGPALYHYYSGHEELVGAVTATFFDELAAEMADARDAAGDRTVGARILAVCRAMRFWAVAHPAEFGWIFAGPVGARQRRPESVRHQAAVRFERVLLDLTVELWEKQPFPVPTELPGSLRGQLREYCATIDNRLPPEAAHVFLSCWIRLYGLLCMEVLRQLDFAYSDLEPVYEECLRDLSGLLGFAYSGPPPDTR